MWVWRFSLQTEEDMQARCGFGDLVFKQRKTCRHGVGLEI